MGVTLDIGRIHATLAGQSHNAHNGATRPMEKHREGVGIMSKESLRKTEEKTGVALIRPDVMTQYHVVL